MRKPRKNKHGGKRKGAGRRKKDSSVYDDPSVAAMAYLADVAAGRVEPNRDRIAAARAILPYQAPRARAPIKSPPPRQLQSQADLSKQRDAQEDWNRKALEIRTRMGRKDN